MDYNTQALDTFLEVTFNNETNLWRKIIIGFILFIMELEFNIIDLGQYDLSLKYYKLAEENYRLRTIASERTIATFYNNIGNVYRNKLDYNNALQIFSTSNKFISRMIKSIPKELIAGINYSIAEIYYLTNNYH